jgi:hypothetical protein
MKSIDRIAHLLSKTPIKKGTRHPAQDLVKDLNFKKLYLGYYSDKIISDVIFLFSKCEEVPNDYKKSIIKKYINNESIMVRKSVLQAFSVWKDKDCIPLVERYILKENDEELKGYALDIISKIK